MNTIVRVKPVNRSVTITSGGVAQAFMEASAGRNEFCVQNASATTIKISMTLETATDNCVIEGFNFELLPA